MKLFKDTANLTNLMLSNVKDAKVEVGTKVTEYRWTDRRVYEVVDIKTINKKEYITMQLMNSNYRVEVTKYRNNWCAVYKTIEFIKDLPYKELIEDYKNNGGILENGYVLSIIPGITKRHTEYCKLNLTFGLADEFTDLSF